MPEIWLEKYRPIKFEAPAHAPLYAQHDTMQGCGRQLCCRDDPQIACHRRPRPLALWCSSSDGRVASGTFPHLLLTGPPGCGKTTVVHCLARPGGLTRPDGLAVGISSSAVITLVTLAREHLKEHYEQGCIELNASDDRGIDVVREKIKVPEEVYGRHSRHCDEDLPLLMHMLRPTARRARASRSRRFPCQKAS